VDKKDFKEHYYRFNIPKKPRRDSMNHNEGDKQHKKLMDILEERKFKAMSEDWLDE